MSPGRRVSLTTRLTAFFLAALAVVLVGFSAALWLLAREYLHHEMDEHLEAALQTLIAAIEFDPAGLEWEPNQQLAVRRKGGEAGHRLVALPQGPGVDQVRWAVRDGRTGALVDRSLNLEGAAGRRLLSEPFPDATEGPVLRRERFEDEPWRIAQRRVVARHAGAESEIESDSSLYHPALILTAGLSLLPVKVTLLHLARPLAGLSLGL
jgi:two-component system, OmpR family, sensor kinase